jgi:hypothetical protein
VLHTTGFVRKYDLYITEEEPYVFLYYTDSYWYFSDKNHKGYIYAKLQLPEGHMGNLQNQNWAVQSGSDWITVELEMECESKCFLK